MKPMSYILELYSPGSGYDVCVSYETSTPFLTIQAGDIINPRVWEGVGTPGNVLRVVNIEHVIWEGDGRIKHKLCIFTEEVKDTEQVRFDRQTPAVNRKS